MEICSRQPTMFYKNNWLVSTYPPVDRVKVTSLKESEKTITQELETKWNLFNDM